MSYKIEIGELYTIHGSNGYGGIVVKVDRFDEYGCICGPVMDDHGNIEYHSEQGYTARDSNGEHRFGLEPVHPTQIIRKFIGDEKAQIRRDIIKEFIDKIDDFLDTSKVKKQDVKGEVL